jgi:hypothetical protein
MDHANRPIGLPEVMDRTAFPIYGLINNPCNLTLRNHGIGISYLSNLISVTLNFTAPRTSKHTHKLTVISLDRAVESLEREHMSFDLQYPSDKAHRLFRKYHVKEEESKQIEGLFAWSATVAIANMIFSVKVLSWEHLQLSLFLLTSEKSIIIGDGYGLSYHELMHILEGFQIINDRKDVLQQYQRELKDNAIIVAATW